MKLPFTSQQKPKRLVWCQNFPTKARPYIPQLEEVLNTDSLSISSSYKSTLLKIYGVCHKKKQQKKKGEDCKRTEIN